MAEALVSLGTKVTIIEMRRLHHPPALDKEISQTLRAELEKRGGKILTGAGIEKIEDRSGKLAAIQGRYGHPGRDKVSSRSVVYLT